jgi:hypothetical protein
VTSVEASFFSFAAEVETRGLYRGLTIERWIIVTPKEYVASVNEFVRNNMMKDAPRLGVSRFQTFTTESFICLNKLPPYIYPVSGFDVTIHCSNLLGGWSSMFFLSSMSHDVVKQQIRKVFVRNKAL